MDETSGGNEGVPEQPDQVTQGEQGGAQSPQAVNPLTDEMLIAEHLVPQLSSEEKWSPKLYLDSLGIPTAGVGRNMRDAGLRPDEITLMLSNDIRENYRWLGGHFQPWWDTIGPARRAALVDMAFMGASKLLKFVHMLYYLSIGDYVKSASEVVDSEWYKQVGSTRGNRVAAMLESGNWPSDIPYVPQPGETNGPESAPAAPNEPGTGT